MSSSSVTSKYLIPRRLTGRNKFLRFTDLLARDFDEEPNQYRPTHESLDHYYNSGRNIHHAD